VSEDGEFSFAALKDVFKTTSVEAQARNTAALWTALTNVGFTFRRTSTGNRWRFPNWGGAGARPGSSGDSGSETSSPETAASKTKPGKAEVTERVRIIPVPAEQLKDWPENRSEASDRGEQPAKPHSRP
jgi:hypothetical protein